VLRAEFRQERTKPVFDPWLPAPRLIPFLVVRQVRKEHRFTFPQTAVEFVLIEQLVVGQRVFPEAFAGEIGQNVESELLLDFAESIGDAERVNDFETPAGVN
jgi:hypothetical protein